MWVAKSCGKEMNCQPSYCQPFMRFLSNLITPIIRVNFWIMSLEILITNWTMFLSSQNSVSQCCSCLFFLCRTVVYRSHYKRPQFLPKIDFGGPNYRLHRLMLRLMLTGPARLCWRLDRPCRTPSCCVAWQLQHWICHSIVRSEDGDDYIRSLYNLGTLSRRKRYLCDLLEINIMLRTIVNFNYVYQATPA